MTGKHRGKGTPKMARYWSPIILFFTENGVQNTKLSYFYREETGSEQFKSCQKQTKGNRRCEMEKPRKTAVFQGFLAFLNQFETPISACWTEERDELPLSLLPYCSMKWSEVSVNHQFPECINNPIRSIIRFNSWTFCTLHPLSRNCKTISFFLRSPKQFNAIFITLLE